MRLGVQLVPPTLELDRMALRWADRLGQTVAYDAHYLALAETLGCDFRTVDRRLADATGRGPVGALDRQVEARTLSSRKHPASSSCTCCLMLSVGLWRAGGNPS